MDDFCQWRLRDVSVLVMVVRILLNLIIGNHLSDRELQSTCVPALPRRASLLRVRYVLPDLLSEDPNSTHLTLSSWVMHQRLATQVKWG